MAILVFSLSLFSGARKMSGIFTGVPFVTLLDLLTILLPLIFVSCASADPSFPLPVRRSLGFFCGHWGFSLQPLFVLALVQSQQLPHAILHVAQFKFLQYVLICFGTSSLFLLSSLLTSSSSKSTSCAISSPVILLSGSPSASVAR